MSRRTLVERQALAPALVVEHHRLRNGLEVLVLPDTAAPVVAYQTWFRVGSRHEVPGKTGLAHLFEHLMFNQTQNLAAGEFDRRMEAVGGETNAATWVDWTFYKDNLPASQLDLAVRLEADRMACLTLTDRQVESEREVVASERRMRVDDDVDGFLSEELFRRAFERHPYHWPTIGWMADIMAFTTADCLRFYRENYAPGNATIVVVGDVDADDVMARIESAYGPIPDQARPTPAPIVEPAQTGERRAVFAKPVPADRFVLGWRTPAQSHPDWLLLELLHEVLLGGPSSRLHRRLIVETEMASQASGLLMPFREPGLLELSVSMTRGHGADCALAIIDDEVRRIAREPISPRELEKAKNRYETSFWAELETAEGKAEALGMHHTVLGDYRALFGASQRVAAITAADLTRVAAAYLRPEARTVVIAEPSGEDPGDDDGGGDDDDGGDDGGDDGDDGGGGGDHGASDDEAAASEVRS